MRQALGILDDEMRRRAPAVARALRPGLSEARLQEILTAFPHSVPEQVRLLYRWHNGTAELPGGHAYLFLAAQWLPLQEVVKIWGGAQEGYRLGGRSVWDSRWLPIFTDGADGYDVAVCGDGSGAMLTFFFVDLPQTWSDFRDLRSLVEALARRWTAGPTGRVTTARWRKTRMQWPPSAGLTTLSHQTSTSSWLPWTTGRRRSTFRRSGECGRASTRLRCPAESGCLKTGRPAAGVRRLSSSWRSGTGGRPAAPAGSRAGSRRDRQVAGASRTQEAWRAHVTSSRIDPLSDQSLSTCSARDVRT